MYTIVEGDIVEITAHGRFLGETNDNVIHYLATEVVDEPTSLQFMEAFAAVWEGQVLLLQSNLSELLEYRVRTLTGLDVISSERPQFTYTFADEHAPFVESAGALDEIPLTSFVTANVYKRSVGSGQTLYVPVPPTDPPGPEKRFKGRIGLGALVEPQTQDADGNLLTPAVVDLFQAAVNQLLTVSLVGPPGDAEMKMVIVSTQKSGGPRTAAIGLTGVFAYQPVASLLVQNVAGTQNSRKRRNA